MITGARLFAPEGYRSLVKGHYYHFLNSDAVHNRVRLVEFSDLGKDVRTTLITLTRFEFEEALEAGALLASGETDKFRHGLNRLRGSQFQSVKRSGFLPRKPTTKRSTAVFWLSQA
ncbi:hypothetical protein G3435_26430 [Pseudomonas sp. MAFF212428]|uniref:Uncharacterized protein n=1 Tax=Pseudomonas brassicae TaxID=2708063 RepID=A0A6M0CY83_9PSED|nr:hypothetical protein [Pseudomonas brassicae]